MFRVSLRLSCLFLASALAFAPSASAAQTQPTPGGPVPVPYPLTNTMTQPAPMTDSVGRVPFPCWPPIKCGLVTNGPANLQLGARTGEQIEVLAWSWGEIDVHSSDPQEGGEVVGGVDSVGSGQEARRKRPPSTAPLGGPVTRKLDKSSPILMTRPVGEQGETEVSNPSAPPGALTVLVPAGTCVPGATYPAITLRSEGKAYELQDVTVAECGPETLAKGKKAQKEKLQYLQVTMREAIVSN